MRERFEPKAARDAAAARAVGTGRRAPKRPGTVQEGGRARAMEGVAGRGGAWAVGRWGAIGRVGSWALGVGQAHAHIPLTNSQALTNPSQTLRPSQTLTNSQALTNSHKLSNRARHPLPCISLCEDFYAYLHGFIYLELCAYTPLFASSCDMQCASMKLR